MWAINFKQCVSEKINPFAPQFRFNIPDPIRLKF